VEEVRDLATDGGGIEMDAGSESVSVILGSAYRAFLVELEDEDDADERLCEAGVPVFNLGGGTGTGRLGLGSELC
jgi:hypothetical protein